MSKKHSSKTPLFGFWDKNQPFVVVAATRRQPFFCLILLRTGPSVSDLLRLVRVPEGFDPASQSVSGGYESQRVTNATIRALYDM